MSAAVQLDSSARHVRVASDYAGIRKAARELLESEFHREDDERLLKRARTAANGDRVMAAIKPRRTMPDGYYGRVAYLIDLKNMLDIGVHIPADSIAPEEWRGVLAVQQGHADFERSHPRCIACGGLNISLAARCRHCGKDFKR